MENSKAIEKLNMLNEALNFQRRDADECAESLQMAIESLEKQIPQIPTYEGDGEYNGEIVIDTWICPNCTTKYEVDYEDYKYCPNCGQHIDHSTLTEDD